MSNVKEEVLQVKNVRLSFPSLWKKAVFDGKEGKFEATLLLDKADKKTRNKVRAMITQALVDAKLEGKVDKDRMFLRDGDKSEYAGFAGNWSLKAANNVRPKIINRDKSQLSEEDGVMYAGCYVNAVISVWVQNNAYGKRVNANLLGIQFVRDGEPFSGGRAASDDDFDDISDDDDDDDFDDDFVDDSAPF